jgi:hypothetical protein
MKSVLDVNVKDFAGHITRKYIECSVVLLSD